MDMTRASARWISIRRKWKPGDVIDLVFVFDILLRRASPRVRGHSGKVALSHGPILYCLESIDNPGVDIFSAHIGDHLELGIPPSHNSEGRRVPSSVAPRKENSSPSSHITCGATAVPRR